MTESPATSLFDRAQLARRWHSIVYRKRRGPLDWLRRTGWFIRTNRGYRAIVFSTLASLVLAAASALVSSRVWFIVGLLSLFLALVAFTVDWRVKSQEAKDLIAVDVPYSNFGYATPYADWPEAHLPDGHPGLRYHPVLDDCLRREKTVIYIHLGGTWAPSGLAREYWRRWGGKRGQFNEKKIRLATDLLPDVAEVYLEKTDYISYIVTNSLADRRVRSQSKALQELNFESVGLKHGVIPTLRLSDCSNHLGGDLLLIGEGTFWLHQQNHRNFVQAGSLALSASGSFDWDLDTRGADDLLTVVKNGLLRELEEELNLPPTAVPSHEDVRIVRFGRATYTGGKPQFFAIARFAGAKLPRRVGSGDAYTNDVVTVDFDVSSGFAGVAEALKSTAAKYRRVSRPYHVLADALQEMHDADDPLGAWLRFEDR